MDVFNLQWKVIDEISVERKVDSDFIKKLIEDEKFKSIINRGYLLEQIAGDLLLWWKRTSKRKYDNDFINTFNKISELQFN